MIYRKGTKHLAPAFWASIEQHAGRPLEAVVDELFRHETRTMVKWIEAHEYKVFMHRKKIFFFDSEAEAMHFYLVWGGE